MSKAFKAQLWVTIAREPVALAFEADEQYLASQVFQGSKQLLRLFYAAAQVAFAVNDQQRGVYVLDVGYGGQAHVAFRVIPGRRFHAIVGEIPAEVAAAKERKAVNHPAVRHGCF